MIATFTYDKETKALTGRSGDITWIAAIADKVYIIRNKTYCSAEEELMALDGAIENINFPDGFAEELASGRMYPKSFSCGIKSSSGLEMKEVEFDLGDNNNVILPSKSSGVASVTSIKHMGSSLLRELYVGDSPVIKATSRKPTTFKTFNTWGEAQSFADGVDFANDSALDVIVDMTVTTPTVRIFDLDAETEEGS